ncbi:hypothetical protein BJ165DRAFT_267494 [Panaeolus papilionaceus]|nr:hypothetical protein BJ165DRAFT_267494 [Panaeolus papilionaceus]
MPIQPYCLSSSASMGSRNATQISQSSPTSLSPACSNPHSPKTSSEPSTAPSVSPQPTTTQLDPPPQIHIAEFPLFACITGTAPPPLLPKQWTTPSVCCVSGHLVQRMLDRMAVEGEKRSYSGK